MKYSAKYKYKRKLICSNAVWVKFKISFSGLYLIWIMFSVIVFYFIFPYLPKRIWSE